MKIANLLFLVLVSFTLACQQEKAEGDNSNPQRGILGQIREVGQPNLTGAALQMAKLACGALKDKMKRNSRFLGLVDTQGRGARFSMTQENQECSGDARFSFQASLQYDRRGDLGYVDSSGVVRHYVVTDEDKDISEFCLGINRGNNTRVFLGRGGLVDMVNVSYEAANANMVTLQSLTGVEKNAGTVELIKSTTYAIQIRNVRHGSSFLPKGIVTMVEEQKNCLRDPDRSEILKTNIVEIIK